MQREKKRFRGVPINAVTVPMMILLVVLHITIVAVIFMVNNASTSLTEITANSNTYITDATSMQAGSSLLSETSTSFVLTPTLEDGSLNTGTLMAYIRELSVKRRGSDVLAKFEKRDISDGMRSTMTTAAECATRMYETQIHALSLVRSAIPLPNTPQFNSLPRVALTEEEEALSDAEKLQLATNLMIGHEYNEWKQTISQSINACVDQIRAAANAKASAAGKHIAMLRRLLWAVTITIVLVQVFFFMLLYGQVVFPLNRFTRLIDSNHSLDDRKGLREVRVLASAYNALLKRRDALDAILRSAAETDALTNMPNRYRFEQYLLECGDRGYSMAMFLFDINYLKQTNDTQGHLAGDKLIRDAADCISECFGQGEDNCCFRFGGDEFAAVMKHCDIPMIREKIRRFQELEREKGISISMGYAYARDVGDTTFKQLLEEADRRMYDRKKATHSERDREVPEPSEI